MTYSTSADAEKPKMKELTGETFFSSLPHEFSSVTYRVGGHRNDMTGDRFDSELDRLVRDPFVQGSGRLKLDALLQLL